MQYHQKYSEREFIGRGNFGIWLLMAGKVYLVFNNKTFEQLVAKKISLEGMNEA